ncbi:MAG: menaquinone biosynthesis decarboxylase [Syntrophothermus sp.]|uniref:menaquinone biosynthesis decarboxylase n=1 Tax=Syntrophothermus sp. TaxID=2736299 RepID=UPI00257C4942|nr:menaquinone biosynthesis decarboxylase [Syntrophothermus sp.]NSW81992.1 menaquinone biosynthesis decarboxylase [Syntrophothermus sp.]
MSYRNLRDFVSALEYRGWLKRIEAEVDPELEITEVTDRVSKACGPALFFEKVKGSDMPVLINSVGSYERMAMALGVERFSDISGRIEELLGMIENVPDSMLGKLKMLPKLAELSTYMPKKVKSGPCQEVVVSDPSLDILPVLKCWPGDAGRYITLPLVFTKDPETGKPNMGMYRMQVYDSKTTGMHWHAHHDGAQNYRKYCALGKRMEVAVAIGADPATVYSATAPLPKDVYELVFAGFLRRRPVEVVRCRTVDLEVPAEAEIVLEGYVEPGETRVEGPFGDHTGYYSLPEEFPVFHITCITHRRNPIYMTTVVGKPPMEDCYMGKATERIFLPLLRLQLPEIVDINMPLEGVFHNCVLVSIKKSYPRHAKKVMHALWGMGQMMFAKFIVVVNEDVNVQNTSEVAWKVFNNTDPRRDIEIVEGPLDVLDHSSPTPLYGTKVGIDATKKWVTEGHPREWPDDIRMSPEVKNLVDRRWKDYGFE